MSRPAPASAAAPSGAARWRTPRRWGWARRGRTVGGGHDAFAGANRLRRACRRGDGVFERDPGGSPWATVWACTTAVAAMAVAAAAPASGRVHRDGDDPGRTRPA